MNRIFVGRTCRELPEKSTKLSDGRCQNLLEEKRGTSGAIGTFFKSSVGGPWNGGSTRTAEATVLALPAVSLLVNPAAVCLSGGLAFAGVSQLGNCRGDGGFLFHWQAAAGSDSAGTSYRKNPLFVMLMSRADTAFPQLQNSSVETPRQ